MAVGEEEGEEGEVAVAARRVLVKRATRVARHLRHAAAATSKETDSAAVGDDGSKGEGHRAAARRRFSSPPSGLAADGGSEEAPSCGGRIPALNTLTPLKLHLLLERGGNGGQRLLGVRRGDGAGVVVSLLEPQRRPTSSWPVSGAACGHHHGGR